MLDYILELTENVINQLNKISPKDRELIYDQVSFALRQTKAHINSTRKNKLDKPSAVLSNIWQRTSKNIKEINNPMVKQLADTIEEKSKYWADPETYDTQQFDTYNMRIDQVDATLNKLCR